MCVMGCRNYLSSCKCESVTDKRLFLKKSVSKDYDCFRLLSGSFYNNFKANKDAVLLVYKSINIKCTRTVMTFRNYSKQSSLPSQSSSSRKWSKMVKISTPSTLNLANWKYHSKCQTTRSEICKL